MKIDRVTLQALLESMNESAREIHLLSRASVGRASLRRMARIAHKLKGEATIVGMVNLGKIISQFEDYLQQLQKSKQVEAHQLETIGSYLNKILAASERIRQKTRSTASLVAPVSKDNKPVDSCAHSGLKSTLKVLAQNVSRSCGKRVNLNLDKFDISAVPGDMQMKIQDMVIQLVRNAIAHGIEPPQLRKTKGKNETGTVAVIVRTMEKNILVAVRDNGGGIDLEQIRKRLIFKYGIEVKKAAQMPADKLLKALFLPGFSTLSKQKDHAGRGVGLDLVKAYAREMGGSIELDYRDGIFTQFLLKLPLNKTSNVTRLPLKKTLRHTGKKKTSTGIPTLYVKHA